MPERKRADGILQVDHLKAEAHLVEELGLAAAITLINWAESAAIEFYLNFSVDQLEQIMILRFNKGEEPSAPISYVYMQKGGDLVALRRQFEQGLAVDSVDDHQPAGVF